MRMMSLLQALMMVVMTPAPVQAKRAAPARVAPLEIGPWRITPQFRSQSTFFKVSLKAAKNQTAVWETDLYLRNYDPSLETDVQDIHLKSLSQEGSWIVAVDERGQTYKIESETGRRISPDKVIDYTKK